MLYHLCRLPAAAALLSAADACGPLAALPDRALDYAADLSTAKSAIVVVGGWCATGLLCQVRPRTLQLGHCCWQDRAPRVPLHSLYAPVSAR